MIIVIISFLIKTKDNISAKMAESEFHVTISNLSRALIAIVWNNSKSIRAVKKTKLEVTV